MRHPARSQLGRAGMKLFSGCAGHRYLGGASKVAIMVAGASSGNTITGHLVNQPISGVDEGPRAPGHQNSHSQNSLNLASLYEILRSFDGTVGASRYLVRPFVSSVIPAFNSLTKNLWSKSPMVRLQMLAP